MPAVGDALRDLQSFATAGCQPILVRTGKGEATFKDGALPKNTWVVADLSEAVTKIVKETD